MDLVYKQANHLISLSEVLLLDTYRTDLLKKGDTVVDLGAGIGDFSVLASRRVDPIGKVIASILALQKSPDKRRSVFGA